jgi:hypothetical protein
VSAKLSIALVIMLRSRTTAAGVGGIEMVNPALDLALEGN